MGGYPHKVYTNILVHRDFQASVKEDIEGDESIESVLRKYQASFRQNRVSGAKEAVHEVLAVATGLGNAVVQTKLPGSPGLKAAVITVTGLLLSQSRHLDGGGWGEAGKMVGISLTSAGVSDWARNMITPVEPASASSQTPGLPTLVLDSTPVSTNLGAVKDPDHALPDVGLAAGTDTLSRAPRSVYWAWVT